MQTCQMLTSQRQLSRIARAFLAAMAVTFLSSPAFADVFSGTIVSVNAGSGRIVVKARSKATNRSFKISKSAKITLDGKKSFISRIKAGQTVSVFHSESTATRLIVRMTKTKPNVDPIPKSTKPAKSTTSKSNFTKPSKPPQEPIGDPPSRSLTNSGRPSRTTSSRNQDQSNNNEHGGDWNQFRGPNRDNKSVETGLLQSWTSNGPRLAFTAQGFGEGYSSVSISDGKIVSMGNINGGEHVIAVDANTGNRSWATRIAGAYSDGTGNGPRGTPAIVDGKVYALGATGQLACLSLENGRQLWSKNILQEYGGSNITWGISESPLVDGDRVIVTPGGQRATMVALDKNTGRQIWASRVPGANKPAYSSVLPINVGGVRQYVNYTHNGVVGVRATDGNPLWANRESANGTANCSSPIFYNNHVFTASGYGTGGALFRLQSRGNSTTSQLVYTTRDMVNHHGGMVEKDGYLYGSNEGIFACIDLKTGRPVWRSREVKKGSVTYADGHLYCRSEQGPVVLVEATPRAFVEKGRFNQPQRSNKNAWAHPVVADGKLFLRDQDRLLVYDVTN